MKLSIIIPAHNEKQRIEKTIRAYHQFFTEEQKNNLLDFELVVVLNGCTDDTLCIVESLRKQLSNIVIIDLPDAGKGLAIKTGFVNSLTRANDLIGFVDADMATSPTAFYALMKNIDKYDAIIASRYMPGARVYPSRPWYKRWGSKIIYESLIKLLFNLSYYDLQCGAKLFKRKTMTIIVPHLVIRGWAIDLELLYLCKKYGLHTKEIPTVWYDQDDSKLTMRGGIRMLGAVFVLRLRHSFLRFLFRIR